MNIQFQLGLDGLNSPEFLGNRFILSPPTSRSIFKMLNAPVIDCWVYSNMQMEGFSSQRIQQNQMMASNIYFILVIPLIYSLANGHTPTLPTRDHSPKFPSICKHAKLHAQNNCQLSIECPNILQYIRPKIHIIHLSTENWLISIWTSAKIHSETRNSIRLTHSYSDKWSSIPNHP